MPGPSLAWLARSRQGSRHVLVRCGCSPPLLLCAHLIRCAPRACCCFPQEALFRGPPAFRKSKLKAVLRLRGHFAELASDRVGGFVVEAAFGVPHIPSKVLIGRELMDGERRLAGAPSGRALLAKCRIDALKRGEGEWIAGWGATRPLARVAALR